MVAGNRLLSTSLNPPLDQLQFFGDDTQIPQASNSLLVRRPLPSLAEPSEVPVQARQPKPRRELRRSPGTGGPPCLLVIERAVLHERRRPRAIGQAGEIDLAGRDGRRLPIHRAYT